MFTIGYESTIIGYPQTGAHELQGRASAMVDRVQRVNHGRAALAGIWEFHSKMNQAYKILLLASPFFEFASLNKSVSLSNAQ
ncbi:hypothetical protein N7504_012107 [Penicillium tannophilum]|nr:hypothetical protein N7504_012107 [Penicillium tannophilum]